MWLFKIRVFLKKLRLHHCACLCKNEIRLSYKLPIKIHYKYAYCDFITEIFEIHYCGKCLKVSFVFPFTGP